MWNRRFRRRLRFGKGNVYANRSLKRFANRLGRLAEKKALIIGVLNDPLPTITSTGYIISNLCQTAQGNTRTTRVGNKIFGRYVRLIMTIRNTSTNNRYFLRYAIVWPKRVDAAIGDLPTSAPETPIDVDKFTIIQDSHFSIGYRGDPNSNNPDNFCFKKTIPIFQSLQFDDTVQFPQQTTPIIFFWSSATTGDIQLSYTRTFTFTDV